MIKLRNIFFGDFGENIYVNKILNSEQRGSLLYWVYNLIAQNKPQPGFPRVVFYLKDSFKYFLYKQWHERLGLDYICFKSENSNYL